MIIDTHSHLNFKAYDKDREEVIKRTQEQGVVCIDVGVDFKTSQNVVNLAQKYENIFAAIGIHPTEQEEFDAEKYVELAKSKKVVAIGEIGLDYYYKPKGTTKKEKFKQLQKDVFIKQLDLAQELGLPVIIHCRMAYADCFEILKDRNLKGVIHCFTGTFEEAKMFLDIGFYIGVTGIIFKLNLDEVVKKLPLDRILSETDGPYLVPPMAGSEKNEPIFVKHVIQKIADLKSLTFDQVASATFTNAKKLFKLG